MSFGPSRTRRARISSIFREGKVEEDGAVLGQERRVIEVVEAVARRTEEKLGARERTSEDAPLLKELDDGRVVVRVVERIDGKNYAFALRREWIEPLGRGLGVVRVEAIISEEAGGL